MKPDSTAKCADCPGGRVLVGLQTDRFRGGRRLERFVFPTYSNGLVYRHSGSEVECRTSNPRSKTGQGWRTLEPSVAYHVSRPNFKSFQVV